MTLNANNARIFGSDLDCIWLAPYGTALPGGISAALNGAFEDVGWLGPDGIAETLSGSVTKFRGHQGQAVVRTRITEPGSQIGFMALESKPQTNALRYDEKSVSTIGGVRKATRGPGQKVSVRTAVIDLYDIDNTTVKERLEIPRFEVVANGDRTFVGTDIAGYPFLGEIIGNYDHYSNSPEPKTVWTLTISGTPTGGTFTVLVNGFATTPLAYNSASSAVDAAIDAIAGITGVAVTAAGSAGGPYTLTFPSSVIVGANHALTGGTSPSATAA